jgi:hypothetical protein
MAKISDRLRAASAAFADLSRGSSTYRDFFSSAGDLLRKYRQHRRDQLVTVYRGMSEAEYAAVQSTQQLISQAELSGKQPVAPSVLQKWIAHSINSSDPPSPYVSVSGSPRVARHFAVENMPHGFRGAIADLLVLLGAKPAQVASGKTVAKITMRRGDLFRTLHFAQDELLALGHSAIHSISKLDPAEAGWLSYRVFLGAAGQAGILGLGLGKLASIATYHGMYYTLRTIYDSNE